MVEEIYAKYYSDNLKALEILKRHSDLVANKAIKIASGLGNEPVDLTFIEQASRLHDIGIIHTKAEDLYCFGETPYICHGCLGREMLEKEGLPKHALVCERHTGAGLTKEEIINQKLPIPHRDMMPMTLEEEIICFADKFFSKSGDLNKEKSVDKILRSLERHNLQSRLRFEAWCKRFL